MGSACRRAADKSGRPDDCRSTAGRAKLGSARSLAGEAFGGLFAFVGWARIALGCSRADLGLACGTRPAPRKLSGPACNVGISVRSCRTGSELERTTGRTVSWRARAFMGRPCTLSFAAACTCAATGRSVVGSPRRPRTIVGRAAGRRAAQARSCAGDIVEPAGSVMGPTEARHARGTVSARHGRLGPASSGSGAAADRGALLGSAGRGRVGCAEDRGARSSRGAVMVCACCTSGGAGRRSSALECASSDCGMVGAGRGSS